MSYGYRLSASLLQLAQAYTAIANDGRLFMRRYSRKIRRNSGESGFIRCGWHDRFEE
ncbi:hypothetical protein [Paraburkholderia fungorum]|uniref:hypothetical protein n=1 Tax=Paraburkholderia fungorum TaxID=134537 RepID=UPI00351E75E0